MTLIAVEASDVSTAWLAAAARLDGEPKRKALQTVVQIADPAAETPAVRQAMDELLAARQLPCVETVANTIFPEAFARKSLDHADLVERYLGMYPMLQRFPGNKNGTYFGRLIQYPTAGAPFDQVDAVINRIRTQRASGNPKHAARFDASLSFPEDAISVPIYVPGVDKNPMAFPCLSACNFQTDAEGRVHLLATYRYQYLVLKGYGNYLGLGRLLAYVARQTDHHVGQLTVVAGQAHLESPITLVRDMLDRFAADGAGR
jgi:hypothetical protein